jgi:hypothetical protein
LNVHRIFIALYHADTRLSTPLNSFGEQELLHLVTGDRIVPHPTSIHKTPEQRSLAGTISILTSTEELETLGLFTMKTLDHGIRAPHPVNVDENLVQSIEHRLDVDGPGEVVSSDRVFETGFETPRFEHGPADEFPLSFFA